MSSDQHILIGADEGIYTLNLNELHESSMELVSHFPNVSFCMLSVISLTPACTLTVFFYTRIHLISLLYDLLQFLQCCHTVVKTCSRYDL